MKIKHACARIGTQKDVAQLMNVSLPCVKKWVKNNEIPARRVARFCELSGLQPKDINRDMKTIYNTLSSKNHEL